MTLPIAITIGDPAGIGPELSLRVAADADFQPDVPVLLIGSAEVLQRVAGAVGLNVSVCVVADPSEAARKPGVAYVLDVPMDGVSTITPGQVTAANGAAAVAAIERSAELALASQILGTVSAPANKEAFNAAGHHYEGQTEIYAALTNTTAFHTLLIGGPLRVSLVSAHCSMLEAIRRVRADRVERIVGEMHEALRNGFGIATPRIGVAGLNPHAGENGVFGREEIDELAPAIARLRNRGIDVSDPLASDSLFAAHEAGRYDAVLAMYHDQGTIPLKRFGYVSYSAGLPITRTTAGHGTAFDIAWKGIANPELLSRATKIAVDLGTRRLATERA
ncbi:4-hydroxythreonine-4-phosphate dehydrogenase [Georgenia soli]|uniref:4-hydroxythreonine-4-phosphate dehydrogenase n=1 Tax=Georgenia soli TaxID=638953 RepID=A0A2A9F1P4_9MICO|nr:4-hydroxythreonine-4-phosphate dehydrogenase PdxA [Georgenia soli]PFG45088.1 4-hydroxythreonine-4-phosphate dehydrogenase [Georgenia soli]